MSSDPHRNDQLALIDPGQVTPEIFLRAIFGDLYIYAHVTAFPDDPGAIDKDRRGICWGGGFFGELKHRFAPECTEPLNTYTTISLFEPVDGRAVRRRDRFIQCHLIMIDDVGTDKVDPAIVALLPGPSVKLETSPGNHQWGYIVSVPETSQARVNAVLDGLVLHGLSPDGTDPGMRGVTRYCRMPMSVNTKAKYRDPVTGEPWRVRVTEWRPDRMVTLEQLAEPLGIDLSSVRDGGGGSGGFATGTPTAWPEDAPVMQWLADGNHRGDKRGTEGQYHVVCPWVDEHTDGDDSGSWVITHEDGTLGYKCHHGHCQDRTGADFLKATGLRRAHDDWRSRWAFAKQLDALAAGDQVRAPVSVMPVPAGDGSGTGGTIDFFSPGSALVGDAGNGGTSGTEGGTTGYDPVGPTETVSTTPDLTALLNAALAGMPLDPTSPEGAAAIYRYLALIHQARLDQVARRAALIRLRDHFPGGILTYGVLDAQAKTVARELARDELEQRRGGEPDTPDAIAARALDDHIYVAGINRFFRKSSGALFPVDALNLLLDHMTFHAEGGQPGPDGMPPRVTPVKAWGQREHKEVVDHLGWWPGKPQIYSDGERLLCNTYRPPTLQPLAYALDDPMIRVLEALFQHIYGEYWQLARQHMAYTARHPETKIRWQWLVYGDARIGKSLTTKPLKRIFGRSAKVVEPHAIDSGWGDMWYQAKVMVIEEVYRPRDIRFANGLKSKLANSDIEILNIKGGAIVAQVNVASIWLFSNEPDALAFDLGDNKLMVIEALGHLPGCTPEEAGEKLANLGDWLETDEGAGKAYGWLLDTDLSGFTPSRLPVQTEAYKRMAAVSRPDYAQAVDDWLESRQAPFDVDAVRIDEVKVALQRIGHRFGSHELTKALKRAGWSDYRGERRANGERAVSPRFWAPESRCEGLSPGELFDYYEAERAMPAGASGGSGGAGSGPEGG